MGIQLLAIENGQFQENRDRYELYLSLTDIYAYEVRLLQLLFYDFSTFCSPWPNTTHLSVTESRVQIRSGRRYPTPADIWPAQLNLLPDKHLFHTGHRSFKGIPFQKIY